MASSRTPGKASSMCCYLATDPQEITERLTMVSSRNARIPVVESHDNDRTLLRHVGAQFGEAMQSSATVATKNEFEAGLGRDIEEEKIDVKKIVRKCEVNKDC